MPSIKTRYTKEGKPYYTVEIRIKGQKSVNKTFHKLTEAKIWAARTESGIRERRLFPERMRQNKTAKQMIERYIADVLPFRKRATREETICNWWRDELGDINLNDLNPSVIAAGKTKLLKKGRAGSTIQKYLIVITQICDVACNEWEWLQTNPAKAVKRPPSATGRERVLSGKEIAHLLKVAQQDDNIYIIANLALCCGARWGEIAKLQWKDVCFNTKTITLRDTKNKDTRRTPVPTRVLDLLLPFKQDKGYVFLSSTTHDELYGAWERILEESKLTDFRFHDLRHTCATRLAESSASLLEIAAILGHKTMQMVKRYAHLTENSTKAPIEKMNAILFQEIG